MDTEPSGHSSSSTNTNSPHEIMSAQTEEIFDCSYPNCDYRSLWEENVGCHERGHDPTKQWDMSCQVCPQIFRSLVSFFHHMSSQHANKLFCPWCLFLGEDLTDYKAHILAHGRIQLVSTDPSNTNKKVRRCKAETPKSSKVSRGTCSKSFNHGSSLSHHKKKKKNFCSFNTSSNAQNQAEIEDGNQESFEDPDFAKPTAADETSIPSVDETQSEGAAAELLIEKVKIEGETFYSCTICSHKTKRRDNLKKHVVIHTDYRPFGCPIQGCKYRAKLSEYLRRHRRIVHNIELPAKKNAKIPNENFGSVMDCDNQAQVNVNSSANCSMGFACMLCEFIGESELAALEHAQEHRASSF